MEVLTSTDVLFLEQKLGEKKIYFSVHPFLLYNSCVRGGGGG